MDLGLRYGKLIVGRDPLQNAIARGVSLFSYRQLFTLPYTRILNYVHI